MGDYLSLNKSKDDIRKKILDAITNTTELDGMLLDLPSMLEVIGNLKTAISLVNQARVEKRKIDSIISKYREMDKNIESFPSRVHIGEAEIRTVIELDKGTIDLRPYFICCDLEEFTKDKDNLDKLISDVKELYINPRIERNFKDTSLGSSFANHETVAILFAVIDTAESVLTDSRHLQYILDTAAENTRHGISANHFIPDYDDIQINVDHGNSLYKVYREKILEYLNESTTALQTIAHWFQNLLGLASCEEIGNYEERQRLTIHSLREYLSTKYNRDYTFKWDKKEVK